MQLVISAVAGDRDQDEVAVDLLLFLEVENGRRIPLITDRGWSSSQSWQSCSRADIERTARVTVGPDEPFDDRTSADMENDHWAALARISRAHGIDISPRELSLVPSVVELDPGLMAVLKSSSK